MSIMSRAYDSILQQEAEDVGCQDFDNLEGSGFKFRSKPNLPQKSHIHNKQAQSIIYTKVSGVNYGNRQEIINKLTYSDMLTLEREFDNVHDKNAVAVISRCGKIGYIPKEQAKLVAKAIDSGETYKCNIEAITHYTTFLGLDLKLVNQEEKSINDEPQITSSTRPDFEKRNRSQSNTIIRSQIDIYANRYNIIEHLLVNDELKLEREYNKTLQQYDVAVHSPLGKIGFIPQKQASKILNVIELGEEYKCFVTEITNSNKGRFVKIVIVIQQDKQKIELPEVIEPEYEETKKPSTIGCGALVGLIGVIMLAFIIIGGIIAMLTG